MSGLIGSPKKDFVLTQLNYVRMPLLFAYDITHDFLKLGPNIYTDEKIERVYFFCFYSNNIFLPIKLPSSSGKHMHKLIDPIL